MVASQGHLFFFLLNAQLLQHSFSPGRSFTPAARELEAPASRSGRNSAVRALPLCLLDVRPKYRPIKVVTSTHSPRMRPVRVNVVRASVDVLRVYLTGTKETNSTLWLMTNPSRMVILFLARLHLTLMILRKFLCGYWTTLLFMTGIPCGLSQPRTCLT